MLQVVKTTDEDGNVGYTFTDKQGRTVLTRQMNGTEQLDTYYVYDAKGNLCFVLQPMYQTTANVNLYAFQYKYDNRNRPPRMSDSEIMLILVIFHTYRFRDLKLFYITTSLSCKNDVCSVRPTTRFPTQ